MHDTVEAFVEEVERRHDVRPSVRTFEDGTKTAADAAAAIGCEVAQIASSIVMVADGAVVVVVTSGANRVDEDRIAAVRDASTVRMADPDETREATGYGIGGVPPLAHERDLPVLFDQTLLGHETVWTAAGTPDAVWPVDPERLLRLTDGRAVDAVG
ncbi:MAG: YbaK/EbsC family protein [Halanaeroarchaeum sp.]